MTSKQQTEVEGLIEEAAQWCNDFEAPDAKIGDQALDYAWRKYDQIQGNKASISAKDDALLRLAATLMIAEVGALKILHMQTSIWVFLSLGSLAITVVLLVWSRRTTIQQNLPSIKDMLIGMEHSENPKVYLSKCIHPVVNSTLPHAVRRMRNNNYATCFFCFAVLLVIPLAFQVAVNPVHLDQLAAPAESALVEEVVLEEEQAVGESEDQEPSLLPPSAAGGGVVP